MVKATAEVSGFKATDSAQFIDKFAGERAAASTFLCCVVHLPRSSRAGW